MHLRAPALANPAAFLPAADPIAKLGAAVIVMAVAFASRDPVTPAILLAGEGVALAGTGLRPAAVGRLLLPLVVVATLLGTLNALLAGTSAVLPTDGTADRVAVGVALGLRVAAIALAGILALATTDPADLAAGLIGHLHMPARLAVGALATLRLVPVLAIEWQSIGMARRARGVDAGRNPLVAARLAFTAVVILLVSTIRRAARLAMAMDARGFDSGTPRTLARPPRMRRTDWLLLLATAVLGVVAVAVSVAVGSWAFIFG
ncbi:MAG: energy-coupling factor transporter transmembrane protein EcfT [Chloroflexi bacterium]|nr:MAG: energy-coupling factor transporter transmembrane protein EcfT [Chloroflexota bacterium]